MAASPLRLTLALACALGALAAANPPGAAARSVKNPAELPAKVPGVAAAAGLPLPVARTRELIYRLATAGRYEELEALARRTRSFTYHFGFEKRSPAAYWRAEARAGQDPLPKIAALLRMPHALDGGIYMWPAAAAVNPTPADWEALKPTFPAARVARWKADGYTGWRLGIDARGNWMYFVRGD